MRRSTIIMILFIFAVVACKDKGRNVDFTGSYANESKSEYSIAFDTLRIARLNETENSYQVERRTGFQKIRDGIIQPKEYKSENWQSTWNEQNHVLSETEYGRQITPDIDGNSLTLKNTRYQRIK